jgi:enoyl-[acyl-carrier-protein] reductase (NADH)
MVNNPQFYEFAEREPSLFEAMHNVLPINMVEAIDVSNAILYLVSDTGRYVTGSIFKVDAGTTVY